MSNPVDESIRKAIESSGCHILTIEEFERMAGGQFEKGTTPPMPTFHFTVILAGVDVATEDMAEAIYGGCDDATLSSSEGVVKLGFAREASDYISAVNSAIVDIRRAGYAVEAIIRDEEPPSP